MLEIALDSDWDSLNWVGRFPANTFFENRTLPVPRTVIILVGTASDAFSMLAQSFHVCLREFTKFARPGKGLVLGGRADGDGCFVVRCSDGVADGFDRQSVAA